MNVDEFDPTEQQLIAEKYRNVFHKNHYLCICAKHSLFQLYGRSEKFMIHELSVDQLRAKENYCRDILDVVDLLEPGLSKLRGNRSACKLLSLK